MGDIGDIVLYKYSIDNLAAIYNTATRINVSGIDPSLIHANDDRRM